jgi:hypothetical protein
LAGHFARHRTRFAHPEVQLDMSDYKSNVALYPTFQEYFRTHTPPLLAALGAETTHSSCRRGPRCSSATIANATVRFFDTRHFAPETDAPEVAAAIRGFLP